MKPVRFMGDSLKCLRAFPTDARRDVGYRIEALQQGGQPADFKPMPTVGKGVEEIRVQEAGVAFRVIYTARVADAIYVLHAFQKKSQATPRRDLETARERFAQLKRMLP
jgi:phage-related protein